MHVIIQKAFLIVSILTLLDLFNGTAISLHLLWRFTVYFVVFGIGLIIISKFEKGSKK